MVASWLAAQYNLNPAHQYSIVTVTNEDGTAARYLRDEHNQAYMRMYQAPQPGENPAEVERWVDTSLEEKYGHLVPADQELLTMAKRGNIWSDRPGAHLRDSEDSRYQNVAVAVWSTGNVRMVIENGLEVIYGEGVYRLPETAPGAADGTLQIIRGRFDVIDPAMPEVNLPVCYGQSNSIDFCGVWDFAGDVRNPSQDWTADTEMAWWSQPGRQLMFVLASRWPAVPLPVVHWPGYFVNTLSQANQVDLSRDPAPHLDLVDSLLSGSGVNPHPDRVYYLTAAYVFLTREEYRDTRR